MQVGVVGINHKLARLKLRELLAKACERRFSVANYFQLEGSFLLLSTCNRTEIYFSSDNLSQTHTYILTILRAEVGEDFDQKLYSFFGLDCFSHLCRVVAGLDSAILGETEIQGQVKIAYETTRNRTPLSSALHFLFQKAFRVGKLIRAEMNFCRGMPELEHAILHIVEHYFHNSKNAKFLFIGASNTNRRVIHLLANKGFQDLNLCNRTQTRADAVAQETGIRCVPWKNLHDWALYDAVILSTKSPHTLIHSRELHCYDPKLIIDLSVPRNADPLLAKYPVTLLNIDDVTHSLMVWRKKLTSLMTQAEEIVERQTIKYGDIFLRKSLSSRKFSEETYSLQIDC